MRKEEENRMLSEARAMIHQSGLPGQARDNKGDKDVRALSPRAQ